MEVDTIAVDGKKEPARRVMLRLAGWRSILWSGSYWFRESDGTYLKYEGANGPPGKAKTVVELCADKGGVEMPGLAEMPDPCRHAASFSPDISRP